MKSQKKTESVQKKLEKKLQSVDVNNLGTEFPDLTEENVSVLKNILTGHVVGKDICHTWYEEVDNSHSVWYGRVEKLKTRGRGKVPHYKVAYWAEDESYDDAKDFDISKYSLAVDYISQDLIFC